MTAEGYGKSYLCKISESGWTLPYQKLKNPESKRWRLIITKHTRHTWAEVLD
jgi:hypothetical protein